MKNPQIVTPSAWPVLVRALVTTAIIATSAVALETIVRLYFGFPFFSTHDLRAGNITPVANRLVEYHPDLGWMLVSHISMADISTFDYGLRKNRLEPEIPVTGAILAVGDSFTAGSEVKDWESWPAQLEVLLNRRVLNAGIGGYGVDQIVMNAERLVPILKPKVLIVGLLDQDILRNAFSVYGAPKPYFVLEAGKWQIRNSPVPPPALDNPNSIKPILARSATVHLFASALLRDWWFSGVAPRSEFVKVDQGASPGQSACHLLLRLADKMKDIRLVLTMQYGGPFFANKQARGPHSDEVLKCVAGRYEIVDEFDELRAIAERSIDELKTLYVPHPGGAMGHMSKKGNGIMARLLADQIRKGESQE